MYFKMLQSAELFSKFSIPKDTQFISTIFGENEQCFPNKNDIYKSVETYKTKIRNICKIIQS